MCCVRRAQAVPSYATEGAAQDVFVASKTQEPTPQTVSVTTPQQKFGLDWSDGSGSYKLVAGDTSDGCPMWTKEVVLANIGEVCVFVFRSPQRHTWCLATAPCMEEDDDEENLLESNEAGADLPTSCTYSDGEIVTA